ncbi:MAG: MBL fold metallo-hydrolase [Cyanobacteria bacterium HKST-UBA02]|nr:MBL fold metallo-hydrolase [Cyanobacteria bacterium HKST-UBA02]
MADPAKSSPGNIEGDFFVDTSCINCDTCRQLAPDTFADGGDYSRVYKQPESHPDRLAASQALVACPTGSIGKRETDAGLIREATESFPIAIENNVYYCGFNSAASYGGNSFLVVHQGGNWLIDSPRFNRHLEKAIAELGGIRYIFLTHEDDVADAHRFQKAFQAERIIHEAALSAQPDAERVIHDFEDLTLTDDFLIVPTPGHTRGHMVLLYANRYLFTGDHLYLDRQSGRLAAHPRHCWYSWAEQIESMEKLLRLDFQWVLAGHGDRGRIAEQEVKDQLEQLITEMKGMKRRSAR